MSVKNIVLFSTLCFIALFSSANTIADNIMIEHFQQARKIFWDDIYLNDGWTIYCATRINGKAKSLSIDHVFPMTLVVEDIGCKNKYDCRKNSQLYRNIESDLHNFYPSRRDANRLISSSSYGKVKVSTRTLKDCELKVDTKNRIAQPASEVAGDLSRALFYILFEYGITQKEVTNNYEILLDWHYSDPPDNFEVNRNLKIEKYVGTSNIFIEYPELAKTLLEFNKVYIKLKKQYHFVGSRPDYTGKNLKNMDFSGLDLSYVSFQNSDLEGARFYKTNLTGANLSGVNLINARFKKAILTSALFRKTSMKDTAFIDSSLDGILMQDVVATNVLFDNVVLNDSIIINSKFNDSIFRDSKINDVKFYYGEILGTEFTNKSSVLNATFHKGVIKNTKFTNTNLNGTKFDDSYFDSVFMMESDLTNTAFDLNLKSILNGSWFSDAKSLQRITYNKSPASLILLRKSFRDVGLRDKERTLTYAIERTNTNGMKGVDYWFRYILFELTSDYGMSYGRPIFMIILSILIFSLFYIWPIINPGVARILKVEPNLSGDDENEILKYKLNYAVLWAIYFSMISAFNIGWRDINVGNWLVRMQSKNFLLKGEGWVRSVSGVQSLISVYLLATWILSYFGRPFQ